jgi:hypothetical protein
LITSVTSCKTVSPLNEAVPATVSVPLNDKSVDGDVPEVPDEPDPEVPDEPDPDVPDEPVPEVPDDPDVPDEPLVPVDPLDPADPDVPLTTKTSQLPISDGGIGDPIGTIDIFFCTIYDILWYKTTLPA